MVVRTTVDHINPLSKKRTTLTLEDVQVLCRSCNSFKGRGVGVARKKSSQRPRTRFSREKRSRGSGTGQVVLRLPPLAAIRGFPAKSEQQERDRQLVQALPRRSGAKVAREEPRGGRGVQRGPAARVPGGEPTDYAGVRRLREADDATGERARLLGGLPPAAQALAASSPDERNLNSVSDLGSGGLRTRFRMIWMHRRLDASLTYFEKLLSSSVQRVKPRARRLGVAVAFCGGLSAT